MKNKKIRILLSEYFLGRIAFLEAERRFATSSNYRSTLNSIHAFLKGKPLWLDQLDQRLVDQYNAALFGRGICRNTVSFYNRILRAAVNRAAAEGYLTADQAFNHAYTGVDATCKRALSKTVLQRIAAFDPGPDEELALTRDLFLFSFYARGMSFVDIAYLTRKNVAGTMLSYIRHKTGQCLILHMEQGMRDIMSRYAGRCHGEYLFPLIRSDNPAIAHRQYVYRLHRHNLRLKELGLRCGAGSRLNSYSSRHSWATLAVQANVSLSLISAGLGHQSEKTTRIYLDSFSQPQLDNANSKVIRFTLKE